MPQEKNRTLDASDVTGDECSRGSLLHAEDGNGAYPTCSRRSMAG